MTETLHSVTPQTHAGAKAQPRTSLRWRRNLRYIISYGLLLLGACFMLFPLIWMFSASLKPTWQIFTDPPIWVPQHWETVPAGSTTREIQVFQVQHEGEQRKVIQIGERRYTTVLVADSAVLVQSVPTAQLSDAAVTTVGDVVLNVRLWTTDSGTQPVVALMRGKNDSMVVAKVNDLKAAAIRLPLDEVNAGDRADVTLGGTSFRGRTVTINGKVTSVVPVGPESALTVVVPPEVAQQAKLVPAASLTEAASEAVGETDVQTVHIGTDTTDYVTLGTDSWQPIINEAEMAAQVFKAPAGQLGERNDQDVRGVTMQVSSFTPDDGSAAYDVVILVSGTQSSLVMPLNAVQTLRLAQFAELANPRGALTDNIPFRVQDGYAEKDATTSVALIGEPRDMSLVVPAAVVKDAFDVTANDLQRAMFPAIQLDGYRAALQSKLGDTTFPTFFRNSFILVALNIIGHILSCVVVAYAFARLRAPGKNFLFIVLLATMMLPFPVTLVPMYEIFRDLGMVNTLFPLFIRSFFGNAFLIFMLRQFFSSIPMELEEAARIDGASTLTIIWRIFVPLSKPAIATIIIFTFWWTWNSFLEPLIYLNSPSLFPVSLGLSFFKDQYGQVYYDRMIAASVMSMLPMLLIFFFAQRYFIEGIQLTGTKG